MAETLISASAEGKERYRSLYDASVRDPESFWAQQALRLDWFKRWDERASDRKPVEITSRVQCADYFPVRDQALLAHATQIDPESSWFACPVEVQRAAWPTEDYHLARSVVDTEFPEDDLFAGVRERVSR